MNLALKQVILQTVVIDMLKDAMKKNTSKEGFVIVGFPRDIVQAQTFQQKFSVSPVAVLVDCSELELGRNLGQRRGRVDDNKEAVKRRLELYRECTLPMLKSLDEEDRLRVVDGDKEPQKVIKGFSWIRIFGPPHHPPQKI